MCALAAFPTPTWPFLNPIAIGYELNHMYGGCESSLDSIFLQQQQQQQEAQLNYQSPSFTTTQSSSDPSIAKKLNHNASERDRRKKVNTLYSSLRSLLPAGADQMKKLSFPATVSQAIKYIPELQGQVERLVEKKEKLLVRISQHRGLKCEDQQQRKIRRGGTSLTTAISINQLTESEVAIHISMHKVDQKINHLSEILQYLDQDGTFLLLNATSFESFGGMIFYNIHLQVETSYKLESEVLSEKLWSLFDNREELLL